MSNADERIRENMKSYNHLYENCISEENRRISLNLAKHSKRMRRIMKSRHLSDDALVALSYDWINNYENAEHVPVYIYDGITRKERVIIVPTMEELIVQHNVVNALKPMFCKGMYEHSYASLPGRGAHKGKQVIEKWIRTDAKNCKYVLKMDIRHFFDTVPHDKLKAKLRKTIHDEKMLDLLFRIIDVTDVGIPLGFYTSQWLSNWYLQGLDHYIKERLGAVHYMRYMDDMVIFGSNKKVLHRTRQAISDYLENELGLSLKDNWQVFRFSYGNDKGRDLDFMRKMEPWLQMVVTIVCAVIASSGFWAFIQKKNDNKDVKSQMLIGLAHDRIIFLGMHYIERGWITQDEYENLYEYLYKPYEKLGGNGSAKRIMTEVNKLPIRKSTYQPEEVTDHE